MEYLPKLGQIEIKNKYIIPVLFIQFVDQVFSHVRSIIEFM